MRLLYAALACLLAVALPAPAHAYAKPVPPLPPPLPADVWVDPAAELGWLAGMAAGLYNGHTATKLACSLAPDNGNTCQPAPCPSSRMCLTIRWGQFDDDGQHARYSPVFCSGSCGKAGVVEINPEGPMYTGYGFWTPMHHLRLMIQHVGKFIGLPVQPTCVSWMSALNCPTQAFTPAERAQLAGW